MHDFKAGDKVKVVRPVRDSSIEEFGEVFTVYEVYESPLIEGTYVSLLIDGKVSPGWYIDRFVKYEEEEKQMKVEMGKKYRMVDTHEPVRIICVDRITEEDFNPIVGLVKMEDGLEEMLYLDSQGCRIFTKEPAIEEIPAVDWSKVKVDTPIYDEAAYAFEIAQDKFIDNLNSNNKIKSWDIINWE